MAGLINPGVGTASSYLLGSETADHTITGVTAGTSQWIQVLGGPTNLTFALTSIGTTSGGTILIEETDDSNESTTATASTIQSIAASSFTGGAKTLAHVAIGAGIYVRVRISSSITGGGTIYVRLAGQ